MKDRLLHTPEGVRDIYNSECTRKLELENRLGSIMRLYGFEDIETPTFEYFDIFSEERGTVAARDMYKFFDRDGNTLVLRPDITPSIARCIAKYYKDSQTPIRLCYKGNTFINNSDYQGKPKEATQLGAELINDGSVYGDAEMLALTINCLLAGGLSEFQVEIGEVGFFKAIVDEAGFDEDTVEELRRLITDKNTFGLEDFLERNGVTGDLRNLIIQLPTLFGSFDKLEKIRELTSNPRAVEALERLEALYDIMKLYGYERYIGFDLGMLSKYGYYTGIIFNAYTYGIGDAVMSGGRYDHLVGQFGKEAPAIGMAVFVDRLMAALSRQNPSVNVTRPDKLLIVAQEGRYREALSRASVSRNLGKNACIVICKELPVGEEQERLLKASNASSIEIIQ